MLVQPIEAVQDMTDEIGVHPSDHPIVDIDDLKEIVVVGISRATGAVENLTHPPIVTRRPTGSRLALNNHQLTWPDVQKDRLRRRVDPKMLSAHYPLISTPVLAAVVKSGKSLAPTERLNC